MSNAQIEHFKTKLNVWKDQLIDDAGEISVSYREISVK